METFIAFGARFLGTFVEAALFLLLGTLASGLLDAFLSRDDVRRGVPRHPALAALLGSLLGLALPVGEIGVVPVARRLLRQGAPLPLGIAFLLAGPILNPITLAASYAAFHDRSVLIVALRALIGLGVALGIGALFTFQTRRERVLRQTLTAAPESSERRALAPGLRHALRVAGAEAVELGRYLVAGSLLAAGVRMALSPGTLDAWAGRPLTSVLALQAQAFGVAISGPRDAWVAVDFADTYGLSAVLAFLTFGAMVDLKSAAVLLGVLHRRAVAALVLLAFLATTLIAVALALNVWL